MGGIKLGSNGGRPRNLIIKGGEEGLNKEKLYPFLKKRTKCFLSGEKTNNKDEGEKGPL